LIVLALKEEAVALADSTNPDDVVQEA